MTINIWGAESVVRSTTVAADRDAITLLGNGGYVVTWLENGKVYFQLYNGFGQKVGGPADTGATSIANGSRADVQSIGNDGGIVVTWSQEVGNVKTLLARKFNANGSANGDATLVGAATTTLKHGARLSDAATGDWATVYVDVVGTTNTVKFSLNGSVSTTLDIAAGTEPTVTYLGGTKYAVVYKSGTVFKFSVVDTSTSSVTHSSATFNATRVNDVVVLKNADGTPSDKFVVVAENGTAGVVAYRCKTDGTFVDPLQPWTAVGGEKEDSDKPGYASATALKNGGFAVAYLAKNGADNGDVYVRVLDANGNTAVDADGNPSGPILVNMNSAAANNGGQHTPAISEMADGRLAVSWSDSTLGPTIVATTIVDARIMAVTVNGTTTNDIFVGSKYDGDLLNGFGGNDALYGGIGSDTLDGGADNDTLYGETGSDTLIGGTGNDAMYGGANNDTLNAGGDDDSLYGQGDADTLNGDAGNDTLLGGAGADVLNGGTDIDLVSYQDATAGVTINLLDGTLNTGDAQGDTYLNIEGFLGSNYGDLFIGDNNANVFNGGGGSDTVSYAGHAPGVTVDLAAGMGTGGDVLQNFENVIGTDGNDTLTGNSAINVLSGGAGNDTYFVQNTGDYVAEVASGGIDTINTSATYTLAAFVENLVGTGGGAISLTGNDLANSITGNDADNVINGGGGADIMAGGGGNDIYYVDNAGDVIVDSSGIDTVVLAASMSLANFTNIENVMLSSTGAFSLDGSELANTLTGNDAANVLNGFGGNDIIKGLGGNDRLNGGTGNDTIYGSTGKDTLYGGSGKDVFVFDSRSNKRTNLDKIADYVVRDDSIWLDNAAFSSKIGKGALTAPRKLNKAFFTVGEAAKDKNDYIIYSKSKGVLYYDSDGSGGKAKVEIATMKKNLKMTAAEFFVI